MVEPGILERCRNWRFIDCGGEEAKLRFRGRTNTSVVLQDKLVAVSRKHGMQSAVSMKMSDQGSSSLCYIGAEKRAACA